MKRPPVFYLTLLGLAAGLVACDDTNVDVEFAEPFPAGATDVTSFPARQQGRYLSLQDSTQQLRVMPAALLREWKRQEKVAGRWLDSAGVPRRAGTVLVRGHYYRVQPLAADSFRLRWTDSDTLFAFGPGQPGRLRRYKGSYYLNEPNPSQPGSWQVQRLLVAGPRLRWQYPNPDSLRLRALGAGTLQERHAGGRLQVMVQPRSRHTQRQVHRYAGLWLTAGEYERQP